MTDFKWEDPPSVGRRPPSEHWAAVAAELRANPGRWALVRGDCTSKQVAGQFANGIKTGQRASFRPPGAFEAVSRKTGETYGTYARYVGEPS